MQKKVYVIRHVAFEDLGSFESILKDFGYSISYFEAGFDDISFMHMDQPDLLIVLGGPIGVYDEADYPFISEEIAILKDRIFKDLPALGICLGAQLIAKSLGSKVYSGSAGKEIGWSPLILSERGNKNYFRYLDSSATSVLHWHGDTFDLPDGAVLQASTSKYKNQAFTYGNNILALQFHPEITTRGMEKWFIGHANELSSMKISVQKLREDTKYHADALMRSSNPFMREWLGSLA